MTPYSWILRLKFQNERYVSTTSRVFSEIEEIFLRNNADAELARKGFTVIQDIIAEVKASHGKPGYKKQDQNMYSELTDIITNLKEPKDLDADIDRRVWEILNKEGTWIIQKDPNVFFNMVKKAFYLKDLDSYQHIIEKMATIYQGMPSKPETGPLEYLVAQIINCTEDFLTHQKKHFIEAQRKAEFEKNFVIHPKHRQLRRLEAKSNHTEKFVATQTKLFSLVRILATVDNSVHSKTKCLWALITLSEKNVNSQNNFEWSDDLISVLKLLLELEADATWIPEEFVVLEKSHDYSARYTFFQVIMNVLMFKKDLFKLFVDILPLFLPESDIRHNHHSGTVLHALMEIQWELYEGRLSDFLLMYTNIISEVINHDLDVLECLDWFEKTALQLFIQKTHMYEGKLGWNRQQDIWKMYFAIVHLLRSEININTTDYKGRTILHHLADMFPSFLRTIPQNEESAFLNIVKCLISTSNIDVQDKNGCTALHILVKRFGKIDCDRRRNIFWETLQLFTSQLNIHIQDNYGQTVLHILADKIFWKADLGKDFLPIVPILATLENVNTKDKKSITPYSWILKGILKCEKYGGKTATATFSELKTIFLSCGANADLAKDAFPAIRPMEDRALLERLRSIQDVDRKSHRIFDMLREHGKQLLKEKPQLFLMMVKKAPKLLNSRSYLKIMKMMSDIYKKLPDRPNEGPLQSLLELTRNHNFDHQPLMSLLQTLIAVDESHELRTEWFRFLTDNLKDPLWDAGYIKALKLLLEGGADPTWIPGLHGESALCQFPKILFLSSDEESVLLDAVTELFPLLLTEKCLKHSEPQGTLLHALISCSDDDLLEEMPYRLFEQYRGLIRHIVVANPGLPNATDCKGCTPLHLLAKSAYSFLEPRGAYYTGESDDDREYSELGPRHLMIFQLLTRKTNVNATDCGSATPYSWILVGKARWDNINSGIKFLQIEQILLKNGGDTELAKTASAPVWSWIEQELGEWDWKMDRLENLVNYMKTVTNWESSTYRDELSDSIWEKLKKVINPKFIYVALDILSLLAQNAANAQYIWNIGFFEPGDELRYIWFEILGTCAEYGAKPTDQQRDQILSWLDFIVRKEPFVAPFLKILAGVHMKKTFTYNLSFLGEFYKVSPDMIHQGRKLVNAMYKTLDNCARSESLINCLLYISTDTEGVTKLKDNFFESSFSNIWLERSPLHLAAIFLESENSFKSIPDEMIRKYINSKDLHGSTPLHVAYLHNNTHAIQFLQQHGAINDATDIYGVTPKSMGPSIGKHTVHGAQPESSETQQNHSDSEMNAVCSNVMKSKSKTLQQMRPMLVLPENETRDLIAELTELFKRLLKETKYETVGIFITGSLREKLKVGLLDEADLQLRFMGKVIKIGRDDHHMINVAGEDVDSDEFFNSLYYSLSNALHKISWKGINLRPVTFRGPWKLIREGPSLYRGVKVSVDVVPLIMYNEEVKNEHRMQQRLLEGTDFKNHMEFVTLKTPGTAPNMFQNTSFALEWELMDSLPRSCRLAVAIGKALVEAYDQTSGDSLRVEMPITSYMIKTALFYLLDYRSTDSKLSTSGTIKNKRGEFDHLIMTSVESSKYFENTLLKALEIVEGKVKRKRKRMKLNPNTTWLTDEDLATHGEEARVWAHKIFSLIKCLAEKGMKLNSYWHRYAPVSDTRGRVRNVLDRLNYDGEGFGDAEYICDVCDCLLERLDKFTFLE